MLDISLGLGGESMKVISLLGILIVTFSTQAFAGEYTCPETHPEYNKVLKELQTFQKKLKEELKCQEISVNFEKLTGLLGEKKRGEILSLVSNNEGRSLSAENAKKIQGYASSVTEEVGVLVSMIGAAASGELTWTEWLVGTDKCSMDEEDELDGIEKLTKAAYEATNLISKVAGPYGVPLQVGVDVAYGVVQGLQNYAKRNRNIDFDSFEKRQFFESVVCIMSKFDSDIRKLNNPAAHLRNLRSAKAQASRVVRVVSSECLDCDEILNADSDKDAMSAFQQVNAASASMGEKAYEGRANLEWIEGEIEKFNEIANFKTGGIGPRELQSLKILINKYILNTAAPDFLRWYADKASVSNKQLGRSVNAALHEMRENVIESGNRFSYDLPASIEEELEVDMGTFSGVLAAGVVNDFRLAYMRHAPELSNLFFMLNNRDLVEKNSSSYYSLLGEAYDIWKLSDFNVRVVQEYCSFFENTLQYNKSVENACESRKFLWHGLRTGYQSFYLASLIHDEPVLRQLGPFDFRLEVHNNFIERFKGVKEGLSLHVAEEGIDIAEVLESDRGIRLKDGRWNPYGDGYTDSLLWWQKTENYADQFLREFDDLR